MRATVLYWAPGAGLGHLTRAWALCSRLTRWGVSCRVGTHSLYAEGFSRLSGLAVDRIPSARWSADLPSYVSAVRPRLIILDTFPWGLRGEWKKFSLSGVKFVYLARRLKVRQYLEAIGGEWKPDSPTLRRIAILEPLRPEHEILLGRSQAEKPVRLPGRVRLPLDIICPPIPRRLQKLLDTGRLRLLVHSGPENEIKKLAALARKKKTSPSCPLAVISPRPLKIEGAEWFEYYPARNLFPAARELITAGGYNLVAETEEFRQKHSALPFPRKFDDQKGRLESASPGPADGGGPAAEFIASCL